MANLEDNIKSAGGVLDDISQKVKDLGANWEAVSASTSAALGVLSSGLRESNPILSQAIGSCQKMVPLLKDIAKAAFKGGKALKAAFAETGIGLLVVAITEAISLISALHQKAKQAAEDAAKEAERLVDSLNEGNKYLSEWNQDQLKLEEEYNKALQVYNDAIKVGDKVRAEAAMRAAEDYKNRREMVLMLHKSEREMEADAKKAADDRIKAAEAWKSMLDGLMSTIEDIDDEFEIEDDIVLELTDNTKILGEWLSRNMSDIEKQISEINLKADAYKAAGVSEVEVAEWVYEEKKKLREKEEQEEKEKAEAEEARAKAKVASVVSQVTSSLDAFANLSEGLTSLLESDEKNQKKNAKKLKGIKIATATIDTISGAIKAYMACQDIPAPLGQIIGGINAAAVTAAGMANINKIKNTDVESGSTANVGTTASVSYSVPQAQQVYVQNDNTGLLADIANNTANTQTVLVVDDFNKVNDNKNRVKVQASF